MKFKHRKDRKPITKAPTEKFEFKMLEYSLVSIPANPFAIPQIFTQRDLGTACGVIQPDLLFGCGYQGDIWRPVLYTPRDFPGRWAVWNHPMSAAFVVDRLNVGRLDGENRTGWPDDRNIRPFIEWSGGEAWCETERAQKYKLVYFKNPAGKLSWLGFWERGNSAWLHLTDFCPAYGFRGQARVLAESVARGEAPPQVYVERLLETEVLPTGGNAIATESGYCV